MQIIFLSIKNKLYLKMTSYKPELFSQNYIDSKNILSLCFQKQIIQSNDITKKINEFLFEYATGFSLFKRKIYTIKKREKNQLKVAGN